MKNTKAIYYKDGSSTPITEQEALSIKERLLAGDKFIEFQGEFISADTVARIGRHHATATMKKINDNELDMAMLQSGRQDLYRKKRELLKERVINKTKEDKIKQLPEPKDGPDYYLDKYGEKVYS